jgi:DnaK suppressor protein
VKAPAKKAPAKKVSAKAKGSQGRAKRSRRPKPAAKAKPCQRKPKAPVKTRRQDRADQARLSRAKPGHQDGPVSPAKPAGEASFQEKLPRAKAPPRQVPASCQQGRACACRKIRRCPQVSCDRVAARAGGCRCAACPCPAKAPKPSSRLPRSLCRPWRNRWRPPPPNPVTPRPCPARTRAPPPTAAKKDPKLANNWKTKPVDQLSVMPKSWRCLIRNT